MKNKFTIILFILVTVFASASCSNDSNLGKQTEPANTLTIAITRDENSLTPFTYLSSTGTTVNRLIYDTLFMPNLENEIIPWMVSDDYKIENDFRSYTFTILDGQKFHDGTPVTVQDIEFSFTYPKDQNVASQRRICNQIESIHILDEKTMTINLKESDINFLRNGLSVMRIIPRAQYDNQPDGSVVAGTIGSGMYKLAEYQIGEYYLLEAVEDYFKGTPTVKNIRMPIIRDNTVIQQNLISGIFDATTADIGTEMVDTFNNAENIRVFASAGYSPMLLNINNGRAPLNLTEFRTALTYAIDVEHIMRLLYGEYATIGTKAVIRPDHPYSLPGLEYIHDIEKANALLDAAGFDTKNANGTRLTPDGDVCTFEILVYSNNTSRIRAAELVANQLKQVGIELTVKAMEPDTVDAFVWPNFDVSQGRDYDFAMWSWGSSINPDFLALQFASDFTIGTQNVYGYVNDDFDNIIATTYQDIRTVEDLHDVLSDFQNIITDDPGIICFGYLDHIQVANISRYDGWRSGRGVNLINVYSFLDNSEKGAE